MVDVFEEVEEQLRSERYKSMVRKGWPYALAIVLALLIGFGGVWGWREFQESRSAKASEAFVQASEALAGQDKAKAEVTLTELSESGPATYRALALMQLAALRLESGADAEAAELFDRAADVAKEPIVQDAARLKSAYLLFDTLSLEDLRERLDPLAEAGRPYAALAREAVAMKNLAAGQMAEARTAFSVLSLLPEATDDLRARAQAALALIDSGAAKAVPQIVQSAANLPPAATPAAAAVGSPPNPAAEAPVAPAAASNTTGEAQ